MAESAPFIDSYVKEQEWDAEKEESVNNGISKQRSNWFARNWKNVSLVVSITSTLLLTLVVLRVSFQPTRSSSSCKKSLLDSEIDTQRWVPNRWITDYSSADASGMEVVDKNWDAIRAAHGVVAVDHQWAAQNGLPPADSLPSDNSKGVYVLEAYHALHCLVVIRHAMFQLARKETLDVPFGHSTHCIDAVRQSIMCNVDDTLLYRKYNVSDGDGQMRKCRNWGALREWASKNSACYVDSKAATLYEQPEGCDLRKSSGDGVIVRDWPEE